MSRLLFWMVMLACFASGQRGWGQAIDSYASLEASISALNIGLANRDCHELWSKHKVCVTESLATVDGRHVIVTKSSEVTDQGKTCVFFSDTILDFADLDPTYVMPMDNWMGSWVKMTTTDSKDTLVATGYGAPVTCNATNGGHWLSLNFRDAASRDEGLKVLRRALVTARGKASIFSDEQLGNQSSLAATTGWLKAFLEVSTSGSTEVWAKMNVTRATAVRSADGCTLVLDMNETRSGEDGIGTATTEETIPLSDIEPSRFTVTPSAAGFQLMMYTRNGTKSVGMVHTSGSNVTWKDTRDHATVSAFAEREGADRVVRGLRHAVEICSAK